MQGWSASVRSVRSEILDDASCMLLWLVSGNHLEASCTKHGTLAILTGSRVGNSAELNAGFAFDVEGLPHCGKWVCSY